MKKILLIILAMISLFPDCSAAAKAPKGKLVYCSYSSRGMAALGSDYCELIADPGKTPKVVVVLDSDCHFAKERRQEFEVSQEVVDSLQQKLSDATVWKLNGYSVDEKMTGGRAYRIYMEYDSGDKVNARWYGHNIQDKAWTAYHLIKAFFQPWVNQMPPQERF